MTKLFDPWAGRGVFLIKGSQTLDTAGKDIFYNDIDAGSVATFRKANKQFNLNIPDSNITCQDFLRFEGSMKNFRLVGNPPYNYQGQGRAPCYHDHLGKAVELQPKSTTVVIPTNWFSQYKLNLGKSVRKHLVDLGVHKIKVNPIDLFENAQVSTCTVYCELGYQGDITLVNDTGASFVINDFNDWILPEFNDVARGMLYKCKPTEPYTTHKSSEGDESLYSICTSYMCYNNLRQKPLNEIKILEPAYAKASGYRTFCQTKSKKQAEHLRECYQAFWHSNLVQFIMRRTRTSTTLDNPQISWVPVLETLTDVYTDAEIYKAFDLTQAEIDLVEAEAQQYANN